MKKFLSLFKRKSVIDRIDDYNQVSIQKLNKKLGFEGVYQNDETR